MRVPGIVLGCSADWFMCSRAARLQAEIETAERKKLEETKKAAEKEAERRRPTSVRSRVVSVSPFLVEAPMDEG